MIPKMHLACAKNDIRESLKFVLVDGESAIATDAKILVRAWISFSLPDNFLKAIQGYKVAAKTWELLCQNGTIPYLSDDNKPMLMSKYGKVLFEDNKETQFPDWKSVLRSIQDPQPISEFGIDANLFGTVQRILGTQCLRVSSLGPNKGFLISAEESGHALVMPKVIQEIDFKAEMEKFLA